ncbi:hypothetical protein J3064_002883 [Listeria monocytogenes]|nr:hypothetical protein [Listeria monocytogenes]EHG1823771.1 hypothetical protein [Listeria monocytogenes]
MTLIFWTKNGQEMKFDLVENVEIDETIITFDYYGEGVKRGVVFILNNLAGMAVEDEYSESENGVFQFNVYRG